MNDPDLRPAIRDLAARVDEICPPSELEGAVMAEFDRVRRRRPARFLAIAGSLAASLLMGALLLAPKPPATGDMAVQSAPPAESQQFYPIPYTAPLQPYERVTVVQSNVPVRALIAAGFHVQTSDPSSSVMADVMVSQDGRPRAIRPVAYNLSDRRSIP